MTGGLIQLVAYGFEDLFLTGNPQITYFKTVFRRHTNFSKEQIPQNFLGTGKFGKKVSCTLSKDGDLIGNILLLVTLPSINQFTETDTISKFAWVHRIGFSLIKTIEIEINDIIIDRHYGDWLSLWSELAGDFYGDQQRGFYNMIGEISDLYGFSKTKDEYTLYVPLQFWFCRSSGLAIPLISLHYSDVKLNIEFNDEDKCYIVAPTSYIVCLGNISNYTDYEYIEQNINGDIRAGLFVKFDVTTKRLYYVQLTNDTFAGIPALGVSTQAEKDAILAQATTSWYYITGKTSRFSMYPDFNVTSLSYTVSKIRNLKFKDCFLLVDYYFLNDDERVRMSQSKHDYLIEQLFQTPDITIDGINRDSRIIVDQPCKLLVWILQLKSNVNSKDYYNYSDSYRHKIEEDTQLPDLVVGQVTGSSIVSDETILLNGYERLSSRSSDYFNMIQPHQHFKFSPQVGINAYSFGLFPTLIQPSGTCNMSQIDDILIRTKVGSNITSSNSAVFRAYGLSYNILRITSGIGGVVFTR
jgi:hypothetical protein